jgi:hypothetical protein
MKSNTALLVAAVVALLVLPVSAWGTRGLALSAVECLLFGLLVVMR